MTILWLVDRKAQSKYPRWYSVDMFAYEFDLQGWFLKGQVVQAVEAQFQDMSRANVSFVYAKLYLLSTLHESTHLPGVVSYFLAPDHNPCLPGDTETCVTLESYINTIHLFISHCKTQPDGTTHASAY